MQNMDFNFILIITNMIVIYVIIILLLFMIIKPYLQKRNEIRFMEVQNEKMNLMMKLDPAAAEEEFDKLVKKYLNEYVLNKFIVNDVEYIRREEIETMVKDLDKIIMIELSELYIFYIRVQREVSNETDILKYVNKKVKEHVLEFVTEFNKSRQK